MVRMFTRVEIVKRNKKMSNFWNERLVETSYNIFATRITTIMNACTVTRRVVKKRHFGINKAMTRQG